MAEKASKTFTYTFTDTEDVERTVVVKKFDRVLTLGLLRTFKNADEMDLIIELIDRATDKENREILDAISAPGLGEFYEAWQADSGVTAGES